MRTFLFDWMAFIRYDLMLDQIKPWNLDPEFLIDFLLLPDSYFYPDSPKKFGNYVF